MKKEIIRKYSYEIDRLVKSVRKWMTTQTEDVVNAQLHSYVEDEFFRDERLKKIDIHEISVIIDAVYRRVVNKYGILTDLLEDVHVNEIMVNGPNEIFAEKNSRVVSIDDAYTSEMELEEAIRMFASDVHREINEARPIVDARLESGYRVNGVLNNVALNGPILTIRKFSEKDIEISDMIRCGSISRECAEDLFALVNSGYNVFISGGTSSGKTTFLNAMARAINSDERVIIIEDSAELKIKQL